MSTARDLLIVALGVPSGRPVEQGDLSLALAGAELVDLLDAEAVTLDDVHIVPGLQPATGDRLLDAAEAALTRQTPYESVEDWLWRRGRGLAAAYADDLQERGRPATGARHHWLPWRSGDDTPAGAPADSPERRHASDRWTSREPVLVGLAAALGIPEGAPEQAPEDLPGDAVVTVLAAVNDALTELEAVRQRRRIEEDAFDNVWRAP
ncbi:GPP34 family phosphoprotein [Streptomyces sp. NPDC101165]|uniref:GPP34 family phosphoprotein n=1 Tax=Streptomyces sp. NPDC101165 TaxID=3366119 RepID=UPI0037F96413